MIIYRHTPTNPKHRLLYLPGAIWKHHSFFAANFLEPNFQQLLLNAGVEIIACEYESTDTYQTIIDQVVSISSQADYIMGLCWGVWPAIAATQANTKALICFDPSVVFPGGAEARCWGDLDDANYIPWPDKQKVKSILMQNLLIKNPNLVPPETAIVSPHKPKTFFIFSNYGVRWNVLGTHGQYLQHLGPVIYRPGIKNSSHYLMIEPRRFELANEVLSIMDHGEYFSQCPFTRQQALAYPLKAYDQEQKNKVTDMYVKYNCLQRQP
jgi:hypothetical protein